MRNRRVWEAQFQREFLSRSFSGADEILAKSQTTLNEAGGFADRPLQRYVVNDNFGLVEARIAAVLVTLIMVIDKMK